MDIKTNENTPTQTEELSTEEKLVAEAQQELDSEKAAPSADSRPEGLPENFKSTSDLAASYKEAQAELTRLKQAQSTKEEAPEEAAEEAPTDLAIDYDQLGKEFLDTGDLSKESRADLNAKGFDNATIDVYLKGIKSQVTETSEAQSSHVDSLYEVTGGADNFTAMSKWAVENADTEMVQAYNQAEASGSTLAAKAILSQLNSAYTKSLGHEGTRLSGVSVNNATDKFHSEAEVLAAMSDVRYKGAGNGLNVDSAYQAEVFRKLANSDI